VTATAVHRLTILTTNDVRLLRALADESLPEHDLRLRLARQPLGSETAMRRLPGLVLRGLVDRRGPFGWCHIAATADGLRALRAADETDAPAMGRREGT